MVNLTIINGIRSRQSAQRTAGLNLNIGSMTIKEEIPSRQSAQELAAAAGPGRYKMVAVPTGLYLNIGNMTIKDEIPSRRSAQEPAGLNLNMGNMTIKVEIPSRQSAQETAGQSLTIVNITIINGIPPRQSALRAAGLCLIIAMVMMVNGILSRLLAGLSLIIAMMIMVNGILSRQSAQETAGPNLNISYITIINGIPSRQSAQETAGLNPNIRDITSENGIPSRQSAQETAAVAGPGPYKMVAVPTAVAGPGPYKMVAVPRGLCLIINNTRYEKGIPSRHSSQETAEPLVELFKKFHFKTLYWQDKSADSMMKAIRFVAGKDHSQYHCFVCFVQTHGAYDVLLGSDGKMVQLKDFIRAVSDQNCPTLIGKPKLFFFDACRTEDPIKAALKSASEFLSNTDEDDELLDYFVGYSTQKYKNAYRNNESGDIYTQEFISVMRDLGKREDLLGIMTKVTENVSKRGVYDREGVKRKQIPDMCVKLNKKLYF